MSPRTLTEADVRAIVTAIKLEESPWRDAQGIAARLGVSVKTVHRLSGPSTLEADRLPSHRIGPNGEKRFHVDEVDEWMRSCNRVAV